MYMNCIFCKGPAHETVKCPVEKNISNLIKYNVGMFMEYFVANNLKCPECKKHKLHVIGDNTPSKDIICKGCKQIFEIKSKCISAYTIPKDIHMHHGIYNKYLEQKNKGLNLIFIIYGVNRLTSVIYIREILYASNFDIDNIVFVNKNKPTDEYNTHSIINIPDRNKLNKLPINSNREIDFSNMVEYLKNNFNF